MRYNSYVIAPTLDADGIAQAQTLAGAGNLTLNGAFGGTLPAEGKVAIAGTGNNSGVTFTVVGTNGYGHAISESLAGPNNNTVTTTRNFKTVSQVSAGAALTGDVTVGSANALESRWYQLESAPMTTIAVARSSDANYTYSIELLFAPFPIAPFDDASWVAFPFSTDLTSKTANAYDVLSGFATGWRIKFASFVAGSATVYVLQQQQSLR